MKPTALSIQHIILMVWIFFLTPSLLLAQPLSKEVHKTFSDGKPEVIYYYKGAKTEANKVKMEKYDRYERMLLVENYLNGKLHGKRQEGFYEWKGKQVPLSEENYQNGLLHGTQTTWFDDREIHKEYNYALGELNGPQIERFDEENIRFQLTYKDGKPEGVQKEWHSSSGTQKYELTFSNGKLQGKQQWWDYSGELTETVWKEGIYTKSQQRNSDRKLEEEYIFERDSGAISMDPTYSKFDDYHVLIRKTWFHENGKPAEQQEVKPEKHYKAWYENGQLKTEGAGVPHDQVGKWVEFHENGQKKAEGDYENRRKVGVWNNWNEQSWLITEETYEWQGIQETKYFEYYPDGKKRSHGGITRGHKDGHWEYFTPEGKKYRDETYKMGPYSGNRFFIKDFTEWYPDGKEKLKGSDGKATHFFYSSTGEKIAEMQLVYKKTRGRHEYLSKEGKLILNPDYEKKRGGGEILEYVFEEGYPLQLDEFYPGGKQKATYRFCKKCTTVPIEELKELNETVGKTCTTCPAYKRAYEQLEQPAMGVLAGDQEGWYENGQQRYKYSFFKGCPSGELAEWRTDGSQIYLAYYRQDSDLEKLYKGEQCASICFSGTWYNPAGKAYEYQHEWTPKSRAKARDTGDFAWLEAKAKHKKISEIEAETYLDQFLKLW